MHKAEPKKIALFLGSDISTHLLMNKLVPALINEGYEPCIFFPKHIPSSKPTLPEIQTQGFFERVIPNEVIYPFLESHKIETESPCHSPKQLGEIYGLNVLEIENINAPDFIDDLERQDIHAGVVIRCYQKFGKEIIQFFNRNSSSCLWNLHPGILPQYRGVMTFFRSMSDRQREASYSLHAIDEQWDAGPIIDIRPEPLDLSKAMLTNYCIIAPSGVPIIIDNLNKLREGKNFPLVAQEKETSRYHTFPTRAEMDSFLQKGFHLVDPEYMRAFYLSNFSVEGTEHHRKLAVMIDKAIDEKIGSAFTRDVSQELFSTPSNE